MSVAEAAEITILYCEACERSVAPPRYACPHCAHEPLSIKNVVGEGKLVSQTTIRRAPIRFISDVPYVVVVVDLDCGMRITGRAVNDSGVAIGERVLARYVENNIAYFSSLRV